MKKKIALINFDLTCRGGSQQVLVNIANALCERYEFYVISLVAENNSCAYLLSSDIHYKNILPYKARIRQAILHGGKKLRAYLKENGIEQVQYVGAYAGLCASIMCRRLTVEKVFCDHGALMNQWHEKPARIMRTLGCRLSDLTVVLTEQSRQAYLDKLKCRYSQVKTIYNWIDEDVYEKAGAYDQNSRKLITAGRFSHEKGYDLLVEVAKKLHDEGVEFIWDIFGGGDTFEEVKSKIQEYGIEKQVILKGLTDRMYEQYQGHALYVLTSYREGLPLVLLEAKANHLPLISFDIVSGPSEIIRDGVDGILVPAYDIAAMADAIKTLLNDEKAKITMSSHACENLELFSKEKILKQWIEIMDGISCDKIREDCI